MNRSMTFWLLLLTTAGASGCREVCSRDEVRQGDRCVLRPDSGMLTDAGEPGVEEDGKQEPEMDASAAEPPEEGDSAAPDDEKEGGTQLPEPGECDAGPRQTVYADGDEDGHGDNTRLRHVCEPTSGYVDNSDDCDDGNKDIYPGARELCNERDDDCNPATPDGVSDCSGLLCEAGSCRTSCSSNAHCLDGLECAGTSCSGKLAAGASCGQDAHCTTGSCTPAATCAAPVGLLGDCNSASDCQAGFSCVNGRCRSDAGQECDSASKCASGHCECANAACSARVCAANDCARCRFDANGDGTCEGAIQRGQDDDLNSCGATSCDGAGGCTAALATPCGADSVCESNACGCSTADCTQRVCIPAVCPPCTYWGGSACLYLASGTEHPGSCAGASACREGACATGKSNGEPCAADAECVAAICAPRAAGGNTCGVGGGLCDSDADCNAANSGCSCNAFGCTHGSCSPCKIVTRECKLPFGPVGCTNDDQCVSLCEADEGECY